MFTGSFSSGARERREFDASQYGKSRTEGACLDSVQAREPESRISLSHSRHSDLDGLHPAGRGCARPAAQQQRSQARSGRQRRRARTGTCGMFVFINIFKCQLSKRSADGAQGFIQPYLCQLCLFQVTVDQNQWYSFGVGAPPILVFFFLWGLGCPLWVRAFDPQPNVNSVRAKRTELVPPSTAGFHRQDAELEARAAALRRGANPDRRSRRPECQVKVGKRPG